MPAHSNTSSCAIKLVFKPTAAGTRTGSLVITDNAADSPQTVALTGVGFAPPDFSMSSSPASMTVALGQVATYTLTVTPVNGFNQTVSLSCSGAPSLATCSVSPASTMLDGTNAANAKVTVTTMGATLLTPRRTAPPSFGPGSPNWLAIILWLVLAAGLATLISGRAPGPRRRLAGMSLATALLVVILWASCGGGGGGGGGGGSPGTPAGSYTLTLTGTYTSTSGGPNLTHTATVKLTVN